MELSYIKINFNGHVAFIVKMPLSMTSTSLYTLEFLYPLEFHAMCNCVNT